VAAFNYAQKVVELPMGVAVGVLGVVLLPRFSELHERGAHDELRALVRQGLWLSWVLAVPATLGLAWFSGPVCDLLFGHGRMSPEAAARVGHLSAIALLALPAQGAVVQLYALLAAKRDTRRPLLAGLLLLGLYLAGAWAARRAWGLEGLVAAGVVLQWALAAAYLLILRGRHQLDVLSAALARDLAVAAFAGAAGFAPLALWLGRRPGERLGPAAALAGAALALAVALVPRYRTLPDGLRTFLKARPA
jgi:putative peptidoglycan lipid II flippase